MKTTIYSLIFSFLFLNNQLLHADNSPAMESVADVTETETPITDTATTVSTATNIASVCGVAFLAFAATILYLNYREQQRWEAYHGALRDIGAVSLTSRTARKVFQDMVVQQAVALGYVFNVLTSQWTDPSGQAVTADELKRKLQVYSAH